MAVFHIGDLVIRKDCKSIGIITKFDREGDPYIDFISGRLSDGDEPLLDWANKYKHLEEKDL